MKRFGLSAAVLVGVLAWAGATLGATIKTRNGASLEGGLQGLLVLEGQTPTEDGKPLPTYFLFNGVDVQIAGALRVELSRDALVLQCMCLSNEIAATAVLERILARPPEKGFRLTRPGSDERLRLARHEQPDLMNTWPFPGSGGSVFCSFGTVRAGGLAGALLGELRSAAATSKATLVPALSIDTGEGVTSLPAEELGP